MLRNFLKNRKAQNTAEYALLIALVTAAYIGLQTLGQRGLNARTADSLQFLETQTSAIGTKTQYEPYYQQSNFDSTSNSTENTRLGSGLAASDSVSNRTRNGSENTTYDGGTSDDNKKL